MELLYQLSYNGITSLPLSRELRSASIPFSRLLILPELLVLTKAKEEITTALHKQKSSWKYFNTLPKIFPVLWLFLTISLLSVG
ncbi:MAG: hypothetical protein COT91_04980 [Candidatus Doudnabacteria bacterium CG10_big_fil_rev_8_21_14_0_10_41_10]|uniref:Uncharacterized protein n=1 Tax=Candidatus Doudnabacteria bacterium CG10_big_fil_rev_8_21_14_0_10_41_10 TaxID=1974551 RepID=A0A2H0VCE8_9BACT|nr:MAG: hypothetical protein COT91_04980 [Candidatus Doudnabacteria bacterium CG10_big_fil_rev_8_21_14_0_10_41_10]